MADNSFAYLLPSVGEIFTGTPAGVSAIIWIIMYCFAMYAGNYVLGRFFKAKKIVNHLKTFRDKLEEDQSEAQAFADELREQRQTRAMALLLRDLVGNLTTNPGYTGAEAGEGSTKYITSTQLNYYLNTRDMVPELFDNKFITFVPSLLTGFGVLGTFIGIQLGIGGLDFKADDIENVTTSITTLLAGSTVAFMTSIWGVFFSLIFSVGEKTLIRKLQYDFQDQEYFIGQLVQFVSPENEIVAIRETNAVLVKQLETIANRLNQIDVQETVKLIGQEMKTAVESATTTTGNADNTELLEELGSTIVSELRLIKEATESSRGSGSLVNLR